MPRIRSERPAFDLHYPKVAGNADFHASPDDANMTAGETAR